MPAGCCGTVTLYPVSYITIHAKACAKTPVTPCHLTCFRKSFAERKKTQNFYITINIHKDRCMIGSRENGFLQEKRERIIFKNIMS